MKQRVVYIMRHGEASHNLGEIVGFSIPANDNNNHLSENGGREVERSAKQLRNMHIDLIVSSPLARTQETAFLVSKVLGNTPIKIEEKLHDYHFGKCHGMNRKKFWTLYPFERRLIEAPPEGESLRDMRTRMMEVFQKILRNYPQKTILIVSHGDPLWILNATLHHIPEKEYPNQWYPKTAEIKKLII